MKKPAFVITEIFFSLVLAASVATAAVFTADIRTNGALLPDEIAGIRLHKSAADITTEEKPAEASRQESKTDAPQTSKEENSKTTDPSKQESEKKPKQESEQASSEPEESKPTAAQELNLQLTEPKDLKTQPKELTKFINDYSYDYDALGFDHLIVVATGEKSTAKIYCYQKSSKGYWWDIAGSGKTITDKAYIGENGADFDIKPGSKKSPLGFYSLGDGFYIGEKPQTTYPLFEITEDTYWVDDTKSKFYNQKVEGTSGKDWSSAEHMISAEKSYKYGLVIDFNTTNPADKKLASSIFMHCGDAPTDGSVVVPENVMKAILEWLQSDSNAYIFIAPRS